MAWGTIAAMVALPMKKQAMDRDAQHIEALRRGDPDGFQWLVHAHQEAIATFCVRYLGDEQAASDVTQDVFLTLWNERRRYRHKEKLRAYLYTIARNRCLAHLKKQKKLMPLDTDDRVESDGPERKILGQQLRKSIRTLEPEFAEVVILRYLQDMELREIAEITRSPVGTVKSRLHRGLLQLRKEWS